MSAPLDAFSSQKLLVLSELVVAFKVFFSFLFFPVRIYEPTPRVCKLYSSHSEVPESKHFSFRRCQEHVSTPTLAKVKISVLLTSCHTSILMYVLRIWRFIKTISSLIIFVILTASLLDIALILQGEIRCRSQIPCQELSFTLLTRLLFLIILYLHFFRMVVQQLAFS